MSVAAVLMPPQPSPTEAGPRDFLEGAALAAALDLEPSAALSFFKSKGIKATFDYRDMLRSEHSAAFTVAKLTDVTLLNEVRKATEAAMKNGTTAAKFRKDLIPLLQKAGWWGKKDVIDPKTGAVVKAQLGSVARLNTIFRTNMQASYAAGNWQAVKAIEDTHPYLVYDAVDDHRTRPEHDDLDNTVLPTGHPFWKTHNPPNGYNCRCGIIAANAAMLKALNLKPAKKWPPQSKKKEAWTNPRTGEKLKIPSDLDPGWDYNPGADYARHIEQVLRERIATLPADMRPSPLAIMQVSKIKPADLDAYMAANLESLQKAFDTPTPSKAAAAQKLAEEIAQAQAKAEKAAAAQAAAQAKAQAALDEAIDGAGTGKDPGNWIKHALSALQKQAEWQALPPGSKLLELDLLAAQKKAAHKKNTQLSQYKLAMVNDKLPSPAATKAFNSLDEDAKDALVAKIAGAKAAKAAKAAQAAQAPPAINPEALTKYGEQAGSNLGGFYLDTETGIRYYIKKPASLDVARNEMLAGKLYELAGVEVPELALITLDGGPAIASRLVAGAAKDENGAIMRSKRIQGLQENFVFDAWLANWDAVGTGFDNVLLIGGRAVRIDAGGALRYRAQGGLKGPAGWRGAVQELESMRDSDLLPDGAQVFARVTDADIESGVRRLAALKEADIADLVHAHGPADKAAAGELLSVLLERRADLIKQHPEALEPASAPPPPPPKRVGIGGTEYLLVKHSRVNGTAFHTDKDHIEDQQVLINEYQDRDGNAKTRLTATIRPEAARRVLGVSELRAAAAGSVGLISDEGLSAKLSQLLRGVNHRAGEPYSLDDKQRADDFMAMAEAMQDTAKKGGIHEAWSEAYSRKYRAWERLVKQIQARYESGQLSEATDFFDSAAPRIQLTLSGAGEGSAIGWTKRNRPGSYAGTTLSRGHAREDGETYTLPKIAEEFEAEIAGGRVKFIPYDAGNAFAAEGRIQIDIDGAGLEAANEAIERLGSLGFDNARGTLEGAQRLLADKTAYIKTISDADQWADYSSLKTTEQRIEWLKFWQSVDVTKHPDWPSPTRHRQAFDHGNILFQRADFSEQVIAKLERDMVLFHNPFGTDETPIRKGVFAKLIPALEGGGQLASIMDRARRGVPPPGTSPELDMDGGGGNYVFTRIKPTDLRRAYTGIVFKARALGRADAITYPSDEFGETRETLMRSARKTTPAQYRAIMNRRRGNDETIFKNGLSLFDEVDLIVLYSRAEVADAIAWMRANGYQAWPDGRPLEDVIVEQGS